MWIIELSQNHVKPSAAKLKVANARKVHRNPFFPLVVKIFQPFSLGGKNALMHDISNQALVEPRPVRRRFVFVRKPSTQISCASGNARRNAGVHFSPEASSFFLLSFHVQRRQHSKPFLYFAHASTVLIGSPLPLPEDHYFHVPRFLISSHAESPHRCRRGTH